MDEEIEHTLHINRDVKVYRIPPRPASTGHISGNWRVADQIFAGRRAVMQQLLWLRHAAAWGFITVQLQMHTSAFVYQQMKSIS
jgi:hypothetical protein